MGNQNEHDLSAGDISNQNKNEINQEFRDDLSEGGRGYQDLSSLKYSLLINKQKYVHRHWVVVTTISCSLALIVFFLWFECRVLDLVSREIKNASSETFREAENNLPATDAKSGTGSPMKPNALPAKQTQIYESSANESSHAKDLAKSEKIATPETSNITIGWPIFALGSITLIAATTLLLGLARVTYRQENDNKESTDAVLPQIELVKQLLELLKPLLGKGGD